MKPPPEAVEEYVKRVTAAISDEIFRQISDRMTAGDCEMVILSATSDGITAIPVSRDEMYGAPPPGEEPKPTETWRTFGQKVDNTG